MDLTCSCDKRNCSLSVLRKWNHLHSNNCNSSTLFTFQRVHLLSNSQTLELASIENLLNSIMMVTSSTLLGISMLRFSFQGMSKWIYGSRSSAVISCTRRFLTDSEYHKVADESLETLLIDLEQYFDELQTPEVDISYSVWIPFHQLFGLCSKVSWLWVSDPEGLMSLTSKLQINRSGFHHLSGALVVVYLIEFNVVLCSGPFRYDYEKGEWIYHRDLHNMKTKISDELISMYKKEPKLH